VKTLRIFISSPGDVAAERLRAYDVVARLQAKFRAHLKLEPILSEHDALCAPAQAAVLPPSKADIVIWILWARIGMRLPPGYKRPDGPLPSGTEWEFEDAGPAYQSRGVPQLYLYRKKAVPSGETLSARKLAEWHRERKALDELLETYFEGGEGAFFTFETDEEFEAMLTQRLEKAIVDKLGEGFDAPADVIWPQDSLGSPFRGLAPFQAEHAPIFFGRNLAVSEIIARLQAQAAGGGVFLMIFGKSGGGKSSLARAGVLAALLEPGTPALEKPVCWRRVIMQPEESPAGLIEGLVAGLRRALPELEGCGYNPGKMTAHLRAAPVHAIPLLQAALERAAQSDAAENPAAAPRAARLLLFVDQFEEIFTSERFNASERAAFVAALSALSRSGLAWVITTMRSDLYARCAEVPELISLKSRGGHYDLMPPNVSEVGEMVRSPAKAAGLRFEMHPASGRMLDDALHEDGCKRPEALPIFEFVLDELYKKRSEDGVLTWEAYGKIGGLEYAIARRGEETQDSLTAAGKTVLRPVLEALVSSNGMDIRRPARLSDLPAGAGEVVDAFTAAGFFVTRADAANEPVISLAHDELLTSWPRLKDLLDQNREFLRIKERIAEAAARWRDGKRAEALLLAQGARLAEAADALRERRADLNPREAEFVQMSLEAAERKRVNTERLHAILAAGGVALAALLFGAIAFWQHLAATQARRDAEAARQAALDSAGNAKFSSERERQLRRETDKLIDFLVVDLPARLEPLGQVGLLDDVLGKVADFRKRTPAALPAGTALRRQFALFSDQGDILATRGHLQEALAVFEKCLAIANKMAAQDPHGAEPRSALFAACEKMGDALKSQGKIPDAMDAYRQGMAIAKKSAETDEKSPSWQAALWESSNNMGDIQSSQGNLDEALTSYRRGLDVAGGLARQDPGKAAWQSALSISHDNVADILNSQGNLDDALKESTQGLEIAKSLAERYPGNTVLQRELSASYDTSGDILASRRKPEDALKAYQQGLSIRQQLAGGDAANAIWQHDLSISHEKVGDVLSSQDKLAEALQEYDQSLSIREKLAALDASNAVWQSDLAIAYYKAGSTAAHMKNATNIPEARAMVEKGYESLVNLNQKSLLTNKEQGWIKVLEAEVARLAGGK